MKSSKVIDLSGGDDISSLQRQRTNKHFNSPRQEHFTDDILSDDVEDIESQASYSERSVSSSWLNQNLQAATDFEGKNPDEQNQQNDNVFLAKSHIVSNNRNSIFLGDSITQVDLGGLVSADDLNVLSIKLGMERTFFAAFNNAWIMAIAGVGLMSVGTNKASTGFGVSILFASILFCLAAFFMHCRRAYVFLKKDTGRTETILWVGMITFVSFVALLLELIFGIMYPYLDRSKAVSIEGA